MTHFPTWFQKRFQSAVIIASGLVLAACSVAPQLTLPPSQSAPPAQTDAPVTTRRLDDNGVLPPVIMQAKSRWVPVRWAELPGFDDDKLHEAWNAWLKSCERPGSTFASLCADARRLSIASNAEQRTWMQARLHLMPNNAPGCRRGCSRTGLNPHRAVLMGC